MNSRIGAFFGTIFLAAAALAVFAGPAPAAGPPEELLKGEMENFRPAAELALVPGLSFEDGKGKPTSLDRFRGKVILLNLWATWCSPCRREMPSLDALQRYMGGDDFQVVALAVDRGGLPKVKEFLDEIGVRNLEPFVDATTRSTRLLRVMGLPTTLLVDQQGRELGRMIGPADWNSPQAISLIRYYLSRQT